MSLFSKRSPIASLPENEYERTIKIKAPNAIEADKVIQILYKMLEEYGSQGIQGLYKASHGALVSGYLDQFRKK